MPFNDGLDGFHFPTEEEVRARMAAEAPPPEAPVAPPAPAAEPPPAAQDPVSAPVQPKAPIANDAVRAFIESKLNLGNKGPDPKLEAARREEQIQHLFNGLGAATAGVGTTMVGNAQAFANAIGGHGYSSPLLEQAAQEKAAAFQRASGGPSPVAQYLAAKKAEEDEAKGNLDNVKAAVDAGKFLNGSDPTSLEARKFALAEREAERRTTQGDRGLGIKEGALEVSKERFEDTKDYHAFQKKIGWERLNSQEKNRALQAYKASLTERSLGDREEKMHNTEGQGVVAPAESQDRFLSPQVAAQLNDKIGAASALKSKIAELRELTEQHRMGIVLPTEAKARAQALISELGPLMNNAQSKLSYSGARASAIQHAYADPRNVGNLVNDFLTGGRYTGANLDELEGIVDNSVRQQSEAHGAHLGKDYSHANPNPRVKTARPGAPGSGTGQGEAEVPDTVKSLKPPAKGQMRIYNPKTGKSAVGTEGTVPDGWVRV